MKLKSVAELSRLNASFETIVIPNGVHTVEDVERECNCTKPEVIKSLLFVGRSPVVVLMTGDKMVDLGKLREMRGDESLHMANKEEVRNITGFPVGAVSPFGLRKMDVIADQAVLDLRLSWLIHNESWKKRNTITGNGSTRRGQAEWTKNWRR